MELSEMRRNILVARIEYIEMEVSEMRRNIL